MAIMSAAPDRRCARRGRWPSYLRRPLQAEELLDLVEHPRLCVRHPGLAGLFVEAFESGRELEVTLGERSGDLRGDLRAVMQDPFEAGLVEAVTRDVGQGDHVGSSELAGEHPHLAEEPGGLDGGHGPGDVA